METLDGKATAQEIHQELQHTLADITIRKPCLTVVLVGADPASQIYVNTKKKKCAAIGITSKSLELPTSTTETELLDHITTLNNDTTVDGIIVQLPLPNHINSTTIASAIAPDKDVDGFHPINLGKLITEEKAFIPCTPLGITVLLERYNIETSGKNVVIVGRSTIVGKPMASLMIQKKPYGNATVTVAHSRTKNLTELCANADIIVAAIGRPNFITNNMVKDGAVIIDVGINRIDDPSSPKGYKVVGDVDFDAVKDKCSFITPVPGGIGPMTVAMLLSNTVTSFLNRIQHTVTAQGRCP